MNLPPLIAKHLNFNGKEVEIFGSIVRKATTEDKTVNQINDEDIYYVVDFNYGKTEFRGLWRQSDCLLIG